MAYIHGLVPVLAHTVISTPVLLFVGIADRAAVNLSFGTLPHLAPHRQQCHEHRQVTLRPQGVTCRCCRPCFWTHLQWHLAQRASLPLPTLPQSPAASAHHWPALRRQGPGHQHMVVSEIGGYLIGVLFIGECHYFGG